VKFVVGSNGKRMEQVYVPYGRIQIPVCFKIDRRMVLDEESVF